MSALEAVQRVHHQALLDAHAAHLRGEGLTYRQIADEMVCSPQTAYERVQRAYGRMPGPTALSDKQRQLQELDDMAVACYAVMEASHYATCARGIVTVKSDGRDVPVPDDHPVLEAIDRLLRIQHRRSLLTGSYAPSKRSVEVITKDALVTAMEHMTAELDDAESRSWERQRGDHHDGN